MAVNDRSIPPGLPQVVPATDAREILKLVRESLRREFESPSYRGAALRNRRVVRCSSCECASGE